MRLVVGIGCAAVLTFWFAYASTHAFAPNADGASVVLEGSSLIHGAPLLHGWWLSLDSFWSVDVPFYSLGVAVFGAVPSLMHLVPAALAALCVTMGLAFVQDGAKSRLEWLGGVGLLAGALVFLSHTGAYFLLQGPWHVGTALYCLIAAALLVRPGLSWRTLIAAALLALGLTGDLQTLAIGVVPIALAGLAAMVRRRSLRSGIAPVLAASAGVGLALMTRIITTSLGTFRAIEHHRTVKAAQLLPDASNFGRWITALFGVRLSPVPGPPISLLAQVCRSVVFALVVLGVVTAIGALLIGAVRGSKGDGANGSVEPWRLDDLLVFMTLGGAALFFLLTLSDNPDYARYLDPVMIYSSILAARVLPRAISRWRRGNTLVACSALGVTLAISAIFSLKDASKAAPVPPTAVLEHYLASHSLTRGIGDYWAASIVTVDTHERVVVRPVVANLRHRIVPDGRNADLSWYRDKRFQFLVYQSLPYGRVEERTIVNTFGRPVFVVQIGQYYVATWRKGLALPPTPFP